jgi:ABC-type sugar transport system ATPase subunit
MAGILFDKVSKSFDGERVIDALELDVADGELLVLVGPSGCGKSTILRMLAGLEPVSGGSIHIGGRRVNELPPQQRKVAMVFQNYALYPHMTVRQNLAYPLKMQRLRRSEIERRVTETAAMLDLSGQLERRPQALSGGQRQRVAMGRAIIREADVFLMDEPLSNLDARLRSQIRTDIAALQARLGITMLYVTHDQTEAMTLGRRVAVLHRGRLLQVAPPHELYASPANVFVAGFIGNPGMNVLRALLEREGDAYRLRVGGQHLALSEAVRRRHPGLADYPDDEILVGVRPEHLVPTEGPAPGILSVDVQAAESLGHETVVYAEGEMQTVATDSPDPAPTSASRQPLVSVLQGHHSMARGEALHLRPDPEKLHLFDLRGNALV